MIFKMNLLFPFSEIRNGQKELIEDIKTVLETGGTLIAHAPTGIGKTAAAITPALEYAVNNDKIILFLTSKQSQHKIVIDTLRLIKDKNKNNDSFSVVDIISKQAMCPRDIAQGYYTLFNEQCIHDQKTRKCRYFRSDKNITNHILMNIMHVEELKDFCTRNVICPHKAAIDAISETNIIICDYNYVFSDIFETVLEKTHKSVSDMILIIDEAHNLPDRLRGQLSGELTMNLIEETAKEINAIDKKLYRHLKGIGRFFDDFIRRMPANTEKNINRENIIDGIEQVLQEALGDSMSYIEFVGALKDAEAGLVEKEKHNKKEMSSVTSLIDFLEKWTTQLPCSRIYKNENTPQLSFRLLDPSVLSGDIISNAHATIMMSGTLYPVEMYADILGAKHSLLKQYKSPFPSENKIVLVTEKLTTLYTERNDSMYIDIAEKISKVHDAVKGNIAVFFPSYLLMEEISKKFESSNDFKIRDKTDNILLENRHMSKSAKDELYRELKINSNKILMGVQSGSLSEGVDYRNNILRAVLIVGLPLSPPTLEVKNLLDYYIKKFGREKGKLYGHIYPAISKVIQAAGRGIRSENDVGAIVLMDYRFNYWEYKKCLPPDYEIHFTDEAEKLCREFFSKPFVLKAIEDAKKKIIEEEDLQTSIKIKSEVWEETGLIEDKGMIPLTVLKCVLEFSEKSDKNEIVGILTGSEVKTIGEHSCTKSKYCGVLENFKTNDIMDVIDELMQKMYLERAGEPLYPTVKISKTGKAAVLKKEKIEIDKIKTISEKLSETKNILPEEASCGEATKISKDGEKVKDNTGLKMLGLINTLGFPAGRSLLADILTGSKSKKLINQNIDKSEYYGILKRYTRDEVIIIIDQITDKGYLIVKQSETTNFPRPLLYMTVLGKNALDNNEQIEVKLQANIKDRNSVSKNPELLKELKFWRKMVADEENLPPYCIFHDKTLIEISNNLPLSVSDLKNIYGFGRKKTEKYSDNILKIVRGHKSNETKLCMTKAGKNAPDNNEQIEVKLQANIKDRNSVSKNPELLKELKFWRKMVADEENLPPYCIFHDKTLIEISNNLPSTKENLMNIRGFGEKKIKKYSDAVLEIIKIYKSNETKL